MQLGAAVVFIVMSAAAAACWLALLMVAAGLCDFPAFRRGVCDFSPMVPVETTEAQSQCRR